MDAELALLDGAEDERAELVRRVHARPPHVLRLPARRLRLIAREVRVAVLNPLAVLVDRRQRCLIFLRAKTFAGLVNWSATGTVVGVKRACPTDVFTL